MKLHLGMIYDNYGILINHRSIIKIIANPLLQLFGFTVYTNIDHNENFVNYEICKSINGKKFNIIKNYKDLIFYKLPEHCKLVKFEHWL